MKPLDWLQYFLARLGWPGTLGLLLLAAAWPLHALYLQPLQDAGAELQRQADRLARQAPVAKLDTGRQPAMLSTTLPGVEQMPEAVARLFSAARHAGLSLEQGVYRVAGEKSSRLLRYQISLPVSGDYPALRAFIAEALEREPSLALDSLRLTRADMGQGVIDADLRFTLYLGDARMAGEP